MTELERIDRQRCPGHLDKPFEIMVCRECSAAAMRLAVGEERAKIIKELRDSGFEEAAKALENAMVHIGE